MDKDFLARLLATFRIEAEEHLRALAEGVSALQKAEDTERGTLLETIYREAHSLKGAARAVSLHDIETVCQHVENVFAALKRNELSPEQQIFDTLLESIDAIGTYLEADDSGREAVILRLDSLAEQLPRLIVLFYRQPDALPPSTPPSPAPPQAPDLSATLSGIAVQPLHEHDTPPQAKEQKSVTQKHPAHDTIRISSAKIDRLFLLAEEMTSIKINFQHLNENMLGLLHLLHDWKREWRKASSMLKMLRKRAEKQPALPQEQQHDDLLHVLNFLDWNFDYVENLEKQLQSSEKFTFQNTKQFGSLLAQISDDLKVLMIMPFTQLTDIIPRMTRELSKDLGKAVDLSIVGADIEVDKRILESLKAPFIHLVRNCIDHGIEPPAERAKKNKPERGTISVVITAAENNRVEVVVKDDGRGIDTAALLSSCLQKNILTDEEAKHLSEQETLQLIFRSGASTSPVITDISGRGLGMAIVKETVEKLNGYISISSRRNEGTVITLYIPMTLAALRGIMVSCCSRHFFLPTTRVERAIRVRRTDIKTIENQETILINDAPVSLVPLANVLGIAPPPRGKEEYLTAVVLSSQDTRVAFIVDSILDENEILIKSLNRQVEKIRNISGVTILGDGKVVPILDTADLLLNARDTSSASPDAAAGRKDAMKKSVLVVDDSITSRMLLKDILETAGYKVKTAIDGVDALSLLRTENFHIVVTDVEMPRMNGFELTRTLRTDARLQEMPVILVTGLSKREDREMGIESGANAYIVKSSFDQSVLLDTIQRLALHND